MVVVVLPSWYLDDINLGSSDLRSGHVSSMYPGSEVFSPGLGASNFQVQVIFED